MSKKCNCGKECELRQNMFYYHDGGSFSGYVCNDCNALYINEEDSIFDYETKLKEKDAGTSSRVKAEG